MNAFLDRFFIDFYLQLRSPELSKSLFFLRKNNFFFKSFFEVGIDFCSFLMPTCLHFSFKNPLKSLQKPILKGIDFLIDFDIDFKTAQDGPKTAQDGPRRRSKRQDGPKRPPKTVPRGSQKTGRLPHVSVLAAKSFPRPPWTPPRLSFGDFFVIFWSIFGRVLVDFG